MKYFSKMQKHVITILLLCVFKSTVSFNVARCPDPLAMALEQLLADMTFEIVPCPSYQNVYTDNQCAFCGMPICPVCSNMYMDPGCYGMPYQTCPNICGYPIAYDQCGQCGGGCPDCSCYRDIRNPCNVFEDSPPLYICFEPCGYDYMQQSPTPYIYFPEVEYPMSAMDLKPYYHGSCWCT